MSIDLHSLAMRVRSELETFQIPGSRSGQLGEPPPREWFEVRLDEMRAALIPPYRAEVRTGGSGEQLSTRAVFIVANNGQGVVVAYAPNDDGDFALLNEISGEFFDCHVGGGAVDCFLAA